MEPDYIAKAAQIASVLEVSGHPKPGNVHRTQDFDDMVFEDFLISGVVIGNIMQQTAEKGLKYREPENFHKIGLGKEIKDAVIETNKWVANNTNLGIIMLLTPICAAAAMSTDLKNTRENVDLLMRATTPEDAVNLYDAISIADAGGMGERDELDVGSSDAKDELIEKGLNMYDVLEISSGWDRLAYELTNKMPITFDVGYPTFKEVKSRGSLNDATLQTFLTILSRYPDTLIERKYGKKVAGDVSKDAKELLDAGGILAENGMEEVRAFDEMMVSKHLNPGTTADLTASSLMISILDGVIGDNH
ncbi:triphosphoribosyl-dephospho-CoA synthase [Methanobacterium aggregans]|uniref:triphosphoribosyl-dephospho-CoA synthase n=1 Tax=Methanobacterium aggregans TaxID=1615586 RepID=UPI00320D74EE